MHAFIAKPGRGTSSQRQISWKQEGLAGLGWVAGFVVGSCLQGELPGPGGGFSGE